MLRVKKNIKPLEGNVCVIKGIHCKTNPDLFMQWEMLSELPFFLFLLAEGCPRVPAPVSVQAALLLSLLLGYAFLFIPLIDDFLKIHAFRRKFICFAGAFAMKKKEDFVLLNFL